jgi:hypothetical protein
MRLKDYGKNGDLLSFITSLHVITIFVETLNYPVGYI